MMHSDDRMHWRIRCAGTQLAKGPTAAAAAAGLRRFVDRKMIVARGLSPCKRASRFGSWICGIDGPSRRVAPRRPAGQHAEFAGTNGQRIDNLIRRNGVGTSPT